MNGLWLGITRGIVTVDYQKSDRENKNRQCHKHYSDVSFVIYRFTMVYITHNFSLPILNYTSMQAMYLALIVWHRGSILHVLDVM